MRTIGQLLPLHAPVVLSCVRISAESRAACAFSWRLFAGFDSRRIFRRPCLWPPGLFIRCASGLFLCRFRRRSGLDFDPCVPVEGEGVALLPVITESFLERISICASSLFFDSEFETLVRCAFIVRSGINHQKKSASFFVFVNSRSGNRTRRVFLRFASR